jgi:hypothetical protein
MIIVFFSPNVKQKNQKIPTYTHKPVDKIKGFQKNKLNLREVTVA